MEFFLGGGERLLFLLESLLGVLELLLLGRDILVDPAVHVHGVHPLAKTFRRSGNLADVLRLVIRVVDKFLNLLEQLVVQVLVLVVVHQRVEEIRLAELLLRLLPRRRLLEHGHHALEAERDHRGRFRVSLHLGHVFFGQDVESGGGRLERGQGQRQAVFALRRDGVRLLGLLADLLGVSLHEPFLFVSRALVLHDDHEELLAVNLGLRHRHALLLGDDGHLLNLHARLVELGQTAPELIALTADLLRFLDE